MTDQNEDQDPEIVAISVINAAIGKVTNDEARSRVLRYMISRYLPQAEAASVLAPPPVSAMASAPVAVVATTPGSQRELPGVAKLTDAGELRITARDLKAKSGLDAAVRLSFIAIYAHYRFMGQPLSSRKGLTPLLKEWRLYDGNTRARLAKERGIIRSGDSLSLDAHAKQDAERFIEEILSDEAEGGWKPR